MSSKKIQKLTFYYWQEPNNLLLLGDIVDSYIAEDLLEQLIDFASQLGAPAKSNPSIANKIGLAGLAIGNYVTAEDFFNCSLELDNDNSSIVFNLAYSLYAQKKFDDCLGIFERNHSAWIKEPKLVRLAARCQHQQGHLTLALESIDQFLQLVPEDIEARGIKSLILLDAGKYQQAKPLALHVLQNAPRQLDALLAIAAVEVTQGNFEEAMTWIEQGIQEYPRVGRFWQSKGQVEMLKTRFDEAEVSFFAAVKRMPNHIGTWHLLAWSQQLNNKSKEARNSFQTAMDIDRNFADSHGALAMMDALDDRLQLAEEHLKRALKLDPYCATGNYAKSILLEKSGKIDEAEILVKKIFSSKVGKNAISLFPLIRKQLESRG